MVNGDEAQVQRHLQRLVEQGGFAPMHDQDLITKDHCPMGDDAIARFLHGLRNLVLTETAVQRQQIHNQWQKPIATRVAEGHAIENVRLVEMRADETVVLTCARNRSRFRPGDILCLSRNDPFSLDAVMVSLLEDEETRLVVTSELPAAWEQFFTAKMGWTLDEGFIDLSGYILSALDEAGDTLVGRERILPLLMGQCRPEIDPGLYAPRLIILSYEVVDDAAQMNVDLRTTLERTIAHPGQGEPATFGFNLFKGINESWLEGEVLSSMTTDEALTTAQVMQAASEQEIDFLFIGETNLDLLPTIGLSAEAEARITTAVLNGKIINVPATAPLINGEPAIGWWKIDLETGETIGVMENGLHNALIEFVGNLIFSTTVGKLTDFMIGATAATFDFVGQQLFKATGEGEFGKPAEKALGKMNQGLGCLLGDKLTCYGISKGFLDYGYMAMEALLNYLNENDPPLPDLLIGNTVVTLTQSSASTVLNLPASLSGGTITADLQTDFAQLTTDDGGLSFYAAALDPLVSGASGGQTAVNHTNSANLTLTAADLQIAAPTGSLSSGGQPVALGDGLAVAHFDGSLDISATTPDTDGVLLNGSGDLFTLTTTPGSSTIAPVDTVQFDVAMAATFSDAFTVTVAAPPGWQVEIDGAGQVTAVPPSGAAADDYTLIVTAQSASYPTLILSAAHAVTVTPYDGLLLDVVPDMLTTAPMGPKLSDQGFINTGQAQVLGAAYIIQLTNPANVPHTYDVSVSGLPAGWTLLAGQSDTNTTLYLPAGAAGQIGLYVTPDSLPAAGTTHSINVTATDENGLSASASETFIMPAVPFSYVSVAPDSQAITTTASVVYDVTIHNVGNAAGEFELTAAANNFDDSISFGPLPAPVNIPAGSSITFPITVAADDAPTRSSRLLFFGSPVADTIYAPEAIAELVIVSATAEPFLNAANRCELSPTLDTAYRALATAVDELSYWCEWGNCPLPLRDQVVSAGGSLVSYATQDASPVALPALAEVTTAVATLAAQTTNEDILATVADLAPAVYALSGESCTVAQHRVNGRFTPYVQAILLGDNASFSLDVSNQGTLTTSYAITLTGLPDGDLFFNETIAPGATANIPVAPAPNSLGNFNLTADIVADIEGEVEVRRTAVARLNVVDKFIQVTQVIADPPFVETGVSATNLSVAVANFAGVGLAANVETAVFAPDGSVLFDTAVPLNLLAGNPRVYELAEVDTSGWAEDVYTITVNLLDGDDNLIPDGSGYGYFSVGQALQLNQAVYPEIVAPGTVTVTTIITSEINSQSSMVNGQSSMTMYDAPLTAADLAYLNPDPAVGAGLVPAPDAPASATPPSVVGLGQPQGLPVQQGEDEAAERPFAEEITHPLTPNSEINADAHALNAVEHTPQNTLFFSPTFTRTEQNDAAWSYTGTWSNFPLQRASGGSYWRNNTAGSTAELAFDGAWISLGFIADRFSGYAEIFIDGDSYGVIDLYRNLETPTAFHFDGLSAGSHTLVIEVLGTANPFASNTRVQLDYADYGDGSLLPDGSFEEDDPRLLTSNGWASVPYAGASGGSYLRANTGAAWFPFAGDSFTLHSIAHSNAGKAQLFVDGVYLDTIDMFAPVSTSAALTRTFSYEGFGSGPHILQIMSYQNQVTIDKIAAPGTVPFIDPNPPVTGVTRFEADHPSLLYNGVPFTQTASTWVRVANINANHASGGEYIYSAAAGDTVSFDFEGEWLGIGFATELRGGQAEIAIDGQLVETVDLYSRYNDIASFYFRDLGAGSHTVTITVLGTSRPEATGNRVHLDYFDVWDGQPLAAGTFEEDDERVILSNGWSRTLNAEASGGAFASSNSNVTAWFAFTGDSFTYHGRTRYTYQDVELRLNGQSLGQFDIYSYQDGFRTYSFDDLGAGLHVLEIRQYRRPVTLDAISSPAIEPAWEAPASAAIVRYEEDHPDMRYNGYPYRTMPQSWALDGTPGWFGSGGHTVRSSTAGNIWSFSFEGEWVNIGLRSTDGGADIRINGVSQGVFNPTGGVNGVRNYPFSLDAGTHLVEVEVISGTIAVDYMDVWQGETMEAGWYDAQLENEETGLFHFSDKQWWRRVADSYAYDGDYLTPFSSANTNIWFTFVGTDLTILGNQRDGTALHVVIDGVDYGLFDMSTPAPFRGQPFSLHFPDLGEGAHVVQVFLPSTGNVTSRIDAFEVNPDGFYSYMPEIKWYDTTGAQGSDPSSYSGFLSTIAIGDLNGDGSVELVAPAANGNLYVYRGDGADTGDGTPILWTSDLVGPAAEPALADLTGDGKAEIVISGENGAFAFTHDGDVLWHNPDVVSFYTAEQIGWGGPSIGNLDLSPEPEIVIASSQDALYVLDHMGNIQWSVPLADRFVTPPVLADVTGNGFLDIIVADKWDLRVYDYFNGGQLVWEYTQPDQIEQLGGAGAFGPPAVADITGDGEPEIIINWGVFVEALRADGSLLWKYDTGNNAHFRPSPITVADTTGDGQMNLVTASAIGGLGILNHTLMVLDAAGNLVWQQLVADTTASASGVSAQDLTGNGVWEVLWNGSADGFLILRGSDGKRLFNEPYTGSGTVLDYPTLGDVDGDGVADVVLAGKNGLFVISHVGHWIDSRPVWNQHNYHVTNINDDWSVPINEPNSWELHNTYRTQTPDRSPAPAYQMVFTYTEGLPNVTVLTHTASISLTANPPIYGWEYRQEWYQPVITTTFDSLLTDMQPGETRQVSAGTEVAYRLPSGFNYLTLPPLYVTASGLGELTPAAQSVVIGGTAVYTLTLKNPGSSTAVYSLFPGGIPAAWLDYPATVSIDPGETVEVTITVTTPPDANPDMLTLWLDIDNGLGGTDDVSADLILFDGLALALWPASQEGTTGQPLTYTLTITNLETAVRTYDLTADGLADVSLPSEITVTGNGTEIVTVTAVPPTHGPQPFTIAAATTSGAAASVDGVAIGDGRFGILAAFDSDTAITGPGATAVYTLTLTNVGDTADSYALDLDIPAGWTAELIQLGQPVSQIELPALLFNSVELLRLVTPDENAAPDNYPITVTAHSLTQLGIVATVVATAEVIERGVSIAITPGHQTIDPTNAAAWEITVTNTGSVADTFDLTLSGSLALIGELATSSVTLAPGASQTVQLTAAHLRFFLPGTQRFALTAQSQADEQIQAEENATFTINGFNDLAVAWLPPTRTVSDTLTTDLTFVLTNTGSLLTGFALDFSGMGLTAVSSLNAINVPPRSTVVLYVEITADSPGDYQLVGTALADGAAADAIATLAFGAPTAVTLHQFTASSHTAGGLPALLIIVLTTLSSLWLWQRRRYGLYPYRL